MRREKSLSEVGLRKTVIGYRPPTETHAETTTPSNDSLPEEYGETKYGIPLKLTLDPEEDKEAALTEGTRGSPQCRKMVRRKQLNNDGSDMAGTQ